MVRSNFDYTNRPSGGEKLGASIAGDFWKKAAQAVKTVKPLAKGSKGFTKKGLVGTVINVATDNVSSAVVQTRIEIKIPYKKLTDEGFRLIAEALTAALKSRPDLALIELDISGNELTIKSICGLTEVIKSAPDLQHLNLSNNGISVSSVSDCAEWVPFVLACSTSAAMTKVDLSHNRNLGARSWEAFVRAISQGEEGYPTRRDSHQHDDPTDLNVSGMTVDDSREVQQNETTPSHKATTSKKAMSLCEPKPSITTRTFAISDTGMDDHGALFVCAILRRTAAWGAPVEFIGAKEETAMTKVGIELFDLTVHGLEEAKHDGHHPATIVDFASPDDTGLVPASTPPDPEANRAVSFNKKFTPNQVTKDEQLERVIKKIQRQIIEIQSYTSVELWSAGISAFLQSRKLYTLVPRHHMQRPDRRHAEHDSPASFGYPLEMQPPDRTQQLFDNLIARGMVTPERSPSSSPSPSKPGRSWAAAVASSPIDYSTDLSSPIVGPEARPEPVWYKEDSRSGKHVRRLKRESQLSQSYIADDISTGMGAATISCGPASDIVEVQRGVFTQDTPALEDITTTMQMTCQEWQLEHMKKLQVQQGGASDGYSDKSLRCQLPLTVCQRILGYVMPEGVLAVMSDRQQQKAFEWGQLHDSLNTEYDWRTRDVSSQIWMLLESIDCLEYD